MEHQKRSLQPSCPTNKLAEEFISLAEAHQEQMSQLCNQCSLLTHSVVGYVSGGSNLLISSSATPHRDSFSSRDKMPSIVRRAQLYQTVMDYKDAVESMQTLYERMGQILEEVNNENKQNKIPVMMNEQQEIEYTDEDSLVAYHVGLCHRAMKTCFQSTIEQEAHAIDQHTYECRTVALAALQASVCQLKKLQQNR